jgi:protein-tyrosine phosphatase
MQQSGVRQVCCLLPPKQLAYYRVDLLERYRKAFGESNVCHAEIEDYHLCNQAILENKILLFLLESDQTSTPVVVHCSGGSGRTGHVLAALRSPMASSRAQVRSRMASSSSILEDRRRDAFRDPTDEAIQEVVVVK